MADSRLWAPDLGAQLGVSGCLKKCQKSSPDARRQQPFSGKSFYLDLPAGKTLQFLTEAIQQLGGVIEGFLSKEVSCIVSSRREAKAESSGTSHGGCSSSSPSEVRVETPSMADPKGSHTRPSQKPVDLVPMSRGKELLQKAIRNQGSSSGGGSGSPSSLLTNARSWGVKILHVDEMMMRVQQLSLDALCVKKQGPKKPEGTCPAESRTRKVARLKAPFLKIEDESRRPKDREPRPRSAARTAPRRKNGYCECCQAAFEELHEHLQSAQHQAFALEAHPYAEVDRIIAQLSHSFAEIPFLASLPRQPGSPASDRDPLSPETVPPSQPSYGGAASPRRRKEDGPQVPSVHDQDGPVGGRKSPSERVGAGEMLGPVTSCQDLGGSVDVVDPPGTVLSRSPTCWCLLTSSEFADLSPGPEPARVGHKRKVQFPSGNAEKRPGVSWPQASLSVSRALSPCGTRTTDGRHLFSLPLPGPESRPLTSPLPLCDPQTSLSLPDPLPWQPSDRPAELWATQPPWPGGGCSPGSEGSEAAAPGPGSQQTDQLPSCSAAPGQLSAHLHSAAGT
ncbi:protein DBF4 homolog B isoform X2 [Myotis daubentonii]|uniref:protein DBF4 homolog B isoform X2 n=1 Tax=Myotis daubentonii TaxID=98922 RepID=UPI002872D460|nr:protein DBF4 homolog B isoform X2 [Myotis daubentonii]